MRQKEFVNDRQTDTQKDRETADGTHPLYPQLFVKGVIHDYQDKVNQDNILYRSRH